MKCLIEPQSSDAKKNDSPAVLTGSSAKVASQSVAPLTAPAQVEALQHSPKSVIAKTSDLISFIRGNQKSNGFVDSTRQSLEPQRHSGVSLDLRGLARSVPCTSVAKNMG